MKPHDRWVIWQEVTVCGSLIRSIFLLFSFFLLKCFPHYLYRFHPSRITILSQAWRAPQLFTACSVSWGNRLENCTGLQSVCCLNSQSCVSVWARVCSRVVLLDLSLEQQFILPLIKLISNNNICLYDSIYFFMISFQNPSCIVLQLKYMSIFNFYSPV